MQTDRQTHPPTTFALLRLLSEPKINILFWLSCHTGLKPQSHSKNCPMTQRPQSGSIFSIDCEMLNPNQEQNQACSPYECHLTEEPVVGFLERIYITIWLEWSKFPNLNDVF